MKKRIALTVFSLVCLSGCNDDDKSVKVTTPGQKSELLIIGHRGASVDGHGVWMDRPGAGAEDLSDSAEYAYGFYPVLLIH